jgi:hypothetical protein
MRIDQGVPEGYIFVGLDPGSTPTFFTDDRAAASWLAIAPKLRRVWRVEAFDPTRMDFVPPGEPSIRPREDNDRP